jgi:hypothetical protein
VEDLQRAAVSAPERCPLCRLGSVLLRPDIIGFVHRGELAMGRAVTFLDLQPNKTIGGAYSAAITQGETQEMAAEYIWIPPGEQWIATAPPLEARPAQEPSRQRYST